ncbi:hypothetical protein M4D57_18635 [Brevibacillus borstelensis]|uniref:hypothetical protein n=1 Tax=Brevibacillus borstelensis TaxID=45462 RepID=UPI00203E481B|nr:hypothetical protein [Brevibacillus borstelensis]MCM3560586.1 hypothetical protein [Brevibacillus borstelensis]
MSGLIGLVLALVGFLLMLGLIIEGIKGIFVSKRIEPINGSIFKGWIAETFGGCVVTIIFFLLSIGLIWGGLSLMNWSAE